MTRCLAKTARFALLPEMDPTAFGGTRWEPWTDAEGSGTAYRLELVMSPVSTPMSPVSTPDLAPGVDKPAPEHQHQFSRRVAHRAEGARQGASWTGVLVGAAAITVLTCVFMMVS